MTNLYSVFYFLLIFHISTRLSSLISEVSIPGRAVVTLLRCVLGWETVCLTLTTPLITFTRNYIGIFNLWMSLCAFIMKLHNNNNQTLHVFWFFTATVKCHLYNTIYIFQYS